MFGVARLPLAEQYAALLAHDGVVRGLIGPRETPRLWDRHVLNSAVLGEVVPPGATVADVGSGAGLPGIPLAIARPDLTVTLIEPLLRRATFLSEAVTTIGLSNVVVTRARGEDLHRDESLSPGFDVVTSRAVSALPQLLDWCMPLVAPDGAMIAMKGSSAADEVAAAGRELGVWGCAAAEVLTVGVNVLSEPTSVVRVAWADPATRTWPARRVAAARPRRDSPPRRQGRRRP